MNYKKGIPRLLVVISVLVFFLGYFLDFSGTEYLHYDAQEMTEISRIATKELSNSECRGGELSFWEEAGNPTKYDFIVHQSKPEPHFSPSECPFLRKYAAILGKEVIEKNRIMVAELTPQIIEKNIAAARKQTLWEIFLDRSYNGAKRVLSAWLLFLGIYMTYLVASWVIRGFRS